MARLRVLPKVLAPAGEVCAREKLGFTDDCEVCGITTKVESYTFSRGGVKRHESGADVTMFDLTFLKLCGYNCFTKTDYYAKRMA